MNRLALVQALFRESRLPGTAPASTASQSGRNGDLVAWIDEAWNEIQRSHNGRWRWLRRAFTVDTVADDDDYAYSEVTDVAASAAISRFRDWDLDPDEPPLIYLTSDGISTQGEMVPLSWRDFRDMYGIGSVTSGYPRHISADPARTLRLGVPPDAIYTVTGNYWRGNQTLAVDGDEPEMPDDYHMLVVWQAITNYAYDVVAAEVLAKARAKGPPLWDALVENQHMGVTMTLGTGGPLA